MDQVLTTLHVFATALVREIRDMHDNEDGYSTEAVVVTSMLVALAIAAVAIIAAKVLSTANGIQTQ